jgi:hypothetical protein
MVVPSLMVGGQEILPARGSYVVEGVVPQVDCQTFAPKHKTIISSQAEANERASEILNEVITRYWYVIHITEVICSRGA